MALKEDPATKISIHALREEGDVRGREMLLIVSSYFYPRPPRGGRQAARRGETSYTTFLSTPSARRATSHIVMPRPPHLISIHALREEGDRQPQAAIAAHKQFLSTPSARRATRDGRRKASARDISIHALREEGDPRWTPKSICTRYFYPRPPRGGRPALHRLRCPKKLFLSTPSARRATPGGECAAQLLQISIHALREEGDGFLQVRGGTRIMISIHALREEGDLS